MRRTRWSKDRRDLEEEREKLTRDRIALAREKMELEEIFQRCEGKSALFKSIPSLYIFFFFNQELNLFPSLFRNPRGGREKAGDNRTRENRAERGLGGPSEGEERVGGERGGGAETH